MSSKRFASHYTGNDPEFEGILRYLVESLGSHEFENGQETFATAATAVVSLRFEQADTNYGVQITPGAGETMWVTGKTKTQFTVNSSNASSTATFDWEVRRL